MEIIKAAIAEDHSPSIREGLKQLLELELDIKVIAGYPDGRHWLIVCDCKARHCTDGY